MAERKTYSRTERLGLKPKAAKPKPKPKAKKEAEGK